MTDRDLASIEASMLDLVRQAYDRGRRDALRKVTEVLREEAAPAEPPKLAAPVAEPPPPKPWWAKR